MSNIPSRSDLKTTISETSPEDIYNIAYWGEGYFSVSDQGNLQITLPSDKQDSSTLSAELQAIVEACRTADLQLPLLVRITNILQHRVQRLNHAFQKAFQQLDIPNGQYTAIYPIKVNQNKRVVNEILAGARSTDGTARVGLEAGSKPEFIAALASLPDQKTPLICNGYKDREYLALAVNAMRMNYPVIVVIEKLTEFETLVALCESSGITPNLGVRIRLNSTGKGNWQNTGGDKGKFGLTAPQLLQFIGHLRQKSWLKHLQLLHIHIGSQISDIQDITRCLTEVGRYFVELKRLGADCRYVDVGGGLGIDYEGTASQNYHSMNYSVEEYALTVTRVLQNVCAEANLALPHLFTESGRALTAHHAILLTNVVDCEQHNECSPERMLIHCDSADPNRLKPEAPSEHAQLNALAELCASCKPPLKPRESLTLYHQLKSTIDHCQQLFQMGTLRLTEKAMADHYFYWGCAQLRPLLDQNSRAHRVLLDELNELLAHRLFLNFSVFQSTPDVWGIGQILPITPISGLHQPQYVRARLNDLTCDSDGRIDLYVDGMGLENTLPLPASNVNTNTVLGIFLVGAYQEILGDLHNLFGDTNSVDVTLNGEGSFELTNLNSGDSIKDVLKTVGFEQEYLKERLEQKIMNSALPQEHKIAFFKQIQHTLNQSTYLQ